MIPAEDRAFLEAVLTVADRALTSGQSVEKVSEDYADGVFSPAGLTICAAEALRLVSAASIPPGKAAHSELAEFSGMCRVLAQVVSTDEQTVTERILRHLTASYRVYRQISDAFARQSR